MSRLLNETSPYLQQHANNPVDWYPWGEAALKQAADLDKPILLSIGYSACHWCHVMAYETFSDEVSAQLMNELFVNIKVDREERPDLDKIYQTAHWMLTQRNGGWPLTMFLTPDQIPFFGGTYFPKYAKHGLPAFTELLQRINTFYRQQYEQISAQNQSLLNGLAQVYNPHGQDTKLSAQPLDEARQQLKQLYDPVWGGFSPAPKFPHTSHLERLLRHWQHSNRSDQQALEMLEHTLTRMAEGGLFDHLGGGFYRYSVDNHWMIPHFEKMLYDNGLLLALYAQVAAASGKTFYHNAATATADWAIRDMQATTGGFYSSLDADSADQEGIFYLWTPDTVKKHLTEKEYVPFSYRYGLDTIANFEDKWHLHAHHDLSSTAQHCGLEHNQVMTLLQHAEEKLLHVRQQRLSPARDEKILTSWNGLMIRGLCIAARYLNRPDYIVAAEQALSFIRQTLWHDNALLATCRGDKAHLRAYLDDYAYLLDAIIEYLQNRWSDDYCQWAQQLANTLLEQYWDQQNDGFFYVSNNHERLIQRPKTFADDAIPNGNAVAAYALARLGLLLSETRYTEVAEKVLLRSAGLMQQQALAHASLLHALEEQLYMPTLWILHGNKKDLDDWSSEIRGLYQPRTMLFAVPDSAKTNLISVLRNKKTVHTTTAYKCQNMCCTAPITNKDAFLRAYAETA